MRYLLIIISMLISLQLNAGIKYVATSGGNNGNNGDIGTPWATLAYAVTAVTSGDTIYMQAGTHTINTAVNIPEGVHLIGAGETSIITTTGLSAEWSYIISLISATPADGVQSISYLKFDGNKQTGAMALWIARRNNVEIHHCTFIDFNYCAVYWVGDGGGNETPPANYVTGSKFFNNIVTNCSAYTSYAYGALYAGGQEGMLIHDNMISQKGRNPGTNGWPIKFQANGGWVKGLKIYNNTLFKDDLANWDFAIEGFWHQGVEIYNNTITGSIDMNYIEKGIYDYGLYVHHNILGPEAYSSSYYHGIILEFSTSDVIIKYNNFRNVHEGIYYTPRSGNTITNHEISYNLFANTREGWGAIRMWAETESFELGTYNLYNNIFDLPNTLYGVAIGGYTSGTTVNIVNNIFVNSSYFVLNLKSLNNLPTLNIKNNIFYNNAQSNQFQFVGTAGAYTNIGNIVDNPDFVGGIPYSYQLAESSPAIDAGLDVGLTTDYRNYVVPANTTPDIGAYEYNSIPSGDAVLVTSITVSGAGGASTISVNDGTLQLSASVLPVDATNKNVTWSISNGTGSATISSGGIVTAVSDGTVTARATANDGSGVYDDMVITISNQSDPEPDPPAAATFIKSGNKFLKYNGKFIK